MRSVLINRSLTVVMIANIPELTTTLFDYRKWGKWRLRDRSLHSANPYKVGDRVFMNIESRAKLGVF